VIGVMGRAYRLSTTRTVALVNEVLCKTVAHNIVVVINAIHELGVNVPQFSPEPRLQLVG